MAKSTMKLPIIVICILSVILTIGLVFFEKTHGNVEEMSTVEVLSVEDLSFEEPSIEEDFVITLEYDENSEVKTTTLNGNLHAPVVSVTKKAEEIILEEDTTATVNKDFNKDEYKMYFTENDIIMVAKTIYGEAGSSWITRENKAKVAWTILNRVNSSRWPNTISAVITQPNQFHGYVSSYPVTSECYEIAKDVLTRWSLEKQGVSIYREADKSITGFYGDGRQNHFYTI